MTDLLILFAKSPEPGRVKTRLLPLFNKEETAKLQEAFILDSLHLIQALNANKAMACSPDTTHPFFHHCEKEHAIPLIPQEGKDLGERMKNAFSWAFSNHFHKVVIIGSDSPTLPRAFIRKAFQALEARSIVLGPSLDGGYYLIGASAPLPDLFSKIPWGTASVLTQTLMRLNEMKIPTSLLPFWYDIDRPDDVAFLKAHLANVDGDEGLRPNYTMELLSIWDRKKRD